MQESYIIYSVQSTEHDLENMLNQSECFAESELGSVYWAVKDELEDE